MLSSVVAGKCLNSRLARIGAVKVVGGKRLPGQSGVQILLFLRILRLSAATAFANEPDWTFPVFAAVNRTRSYETHRRRCKWGS